MSPTTVTPGTKAAILIAIWAAGVALSGCPEASVTPCVANADCASGVCNMDGTCAPPPPDVGFPKDDATDADAVADAVDAPVTPDGSTDPGQDIAQPDVPPGSCSFGDDNIISRDEYPLAAGQHATYRVAHDVTFDSGGDDLGDGTFRWDFGGAYSGDQDVLVQALDPAQWWFDDSFPGATYTTRLSADDDLMGVFQLTDDALLLLGVASPDDGLLRTELVYDPPVAILQFPLEVGAAWSTTATVTGLTTGVATLVTETYDMQVDARGEAVTPFSTFDVLRVATSLTRFVGVTPYTERQLSFVSECFGVVAAARSKAYASQVDFGEAAELRRLAP